MIKAVTKDISKGWIYDALNGWPPNLVQLYCVQDEEWQGIRLSMKGVSTQRKLEILRIYYERKILGLPIRSHSTQRFDCQVDNYLGALRRGGQLDMNNLIKKEY